MRLSTLHEERIRCTSCGRYGDTDDTFCRSCAARLPRPKPVQVEPEPEIEFIPAAEPESEIPEPDDVKTTSGKKLFDEMRRAFYASERIKGSLQQMLGKPTITQKNNTEWKHIWVAHGGVRCDLSVKLEVVDKMGWVVRLVFVDPVARKHLASATYPPSSSEPPQGWAQKWLFRALNNSIRP